MYPVCELSVWLLWFFSIRGTEEIPMETRYESHTTQQAVPNAQEIPEAEN